MQKATVIGIWLVLAGLGFYLTMMVLAFLLGTSECKSSLALSSTASCIRAAVITWEQEDAIQP